MVWVYFTVLKVIFLFMFTIFKCTWGARKGDNFLHVGIVNILSCVGVVIDSDCFL